MTHVNVREQVEQALQGQWATFAANHPRLAEVIDQDLLVEQATSSLADDPEYQQAMAQASAAGMSGEALAELVRKYVGEWLGRLM